MSAALSPPGRITTSKGPFFTASSRDTSGAIVIFESDMTGRGPSTPATVTKNYWFWCEIKKSCYSKKIYLLTFALRKISICGISSVQETPSVIKINAFRLPIFMYKLLDQDSNEKWLV
jgi:hypothetical protein